MSNQTYFFSTRYVEHPKGSISTSVLFFILFLGIGIVYLTHLGVIPLHATADECRRALVPLEMSISGSFLAPTINGELYLLKPPLYNWMVAASYALFDEYSTFALRFPVVISILLHGLVIFMVVRRFCSPYIAALSALAFMTNWRTLTLDSLNGLLEHTLALLLYSSFMLIFLFGEKKKFLWVFIISYALTALGFLIKGLPAIAHQGIALFVYFIFSKNIRRLWSHEHVTGIVVFALICALYYIPFLLVQDIPVQEVWGTLFSESAKRYGFNSLLDVIRVLIDFPLDVLRHFLPWTVFVIFLFQKNALRWIRENRFITCNALLFAANIPVYWVAGLKSPHYLYFLLPLLFTVCFYVFEKTSSNDWRNRIMYGVMGIFLAAAACMSFYLPFSDLVSMVTRVPLKSILLGIGFVGIATLFIKWPEKRIFLFVAGLILFRLAFNWFVIPQRVEDQMLFPRYAENIQVIAGDQPLHILASWPAGYYDPITFPLEKARYEILRVHASPVHGTFYLMDDAMLEKFPSTVLMSFPFVYADRNERFEGKMYLVKR